MADDLARQQAKLAQSVKNAVLEQAAAATALSFAILIAFPVIGWAIGAIVAVVQIFTGRANKKALEAVISNLKSDLAKSQDYYTTKFEAAKDTIYEQERGETIRRIRANETMAGLYGIGLGDFWSKISHTTTQAVKVTGKVAAAVYIVPSKLAATGALKLVGAGAKGVGAKSAGKALNKAGDSVDAEGNRAVDHAGKDLADPKAAGKDVERIGRIVYGSDAVHEARNKAREFLATANKTMADQVASQTKEMSSPKFRAAIRNSIVDRMAKDPAFRDMMFNLPMTTHDPNGATQKLARKQLGTIATYGGVAAAGLFTLFKLR